MADNPAKTWSASCFNFRILMNDNTVIEITNTVGDVHRWEKTQDKKWMAEPPGMGGLLYLAFLAGRRHGPVITETHYENWVDRVVDIDAEPVRRHTDGSVDDPADDLADVDGPGFADPTRPARLAAG